jgi:predicted GNAT superfamily acetyltransferase
VFLEAQMQDVPLVTCEFDVDPPNAASERFHAGLGFHEVAQQVLDSGKRVSLQMKDIASLA